MYAIIESGGKQLRVEKGDVIDVELLEVEPKGKVQFDKVLFFHNDNTALIGEPYLAKCVVKGEVVAEVKGPKEIAFKYKRRKGIRRTVGHRQRYSRVHITDITC